MRKKPQKRANGMGSVYYSDALNRWVAKVTLARGLRKTFYGPLKDRSTTARVGVEERMRPFVGKRSVDGTRTLGEAVSDYLASHTELAVSTLTGYRIAAKHIIGDPHNPKPHLRKPADAIARKKLVDLEPIDIKAFLGRLSPGRPKHGENGSTMKLKIHILLHAVLKEAEDLDLIVRNPVSRVPRPKVRKQPKEIWTPEEMLRFLATIKNHRLYALFLLSISTTMGNAELFGLRWGDLHLDRSELTVSRNLVTVEGKNYEKDPKTQRRRRPIALPKIVVDALRARRKQALAEGTAASVYVFTNRRGDPLRGDSFRSKVWTPLIQKANVKKITPYAMRHCAKALMEHLGVSLELASARMGHSTIKTTADVYGHLYDIAGRTVASKLDEFFAEIAESG